MQPFSTSIAVGSWWPSRLDAAGHVKNGLGVASNAACNDSGCSEHERRVRLSLSLCKWAMPRLSNLCSPYVP